MDARRYNSYPIVFGKSQVDYDTKVILSQFQAAFSVTKRHRLTALEILKAANFNNGLVKITQEGLIENLNAACSKGYLKRDGNFYKLTPSGIDVVGGETKPDLERLQLLQLKNIKYRNK